MAQEDPEAELIIIKYSTQSLEKIWKNYAFFACVDLKCSPSIHPWKLSEIGRYYLDGRKTFIPARINFRNNNFPPKWTLLFLSFSDNFKPPYPCHFVKVDRNNFWECFSVSFKLNRSVKSFSDACHCNHKPSCFFCCLQFRELHMLHAALGTWQ